MIRKAATTNWKTTNPLRNKLADVFGSLIPFRAVAGSKPAINNAGNRPDNKPAKKTIPASINRFEGCNISLADACLPAMLL